MGFIDACSEDKIEEAITDALDDIEYCIGEKSTVWEQ